jgi:hypothetical protein
MIERAGDARSPVSSSLSLATGTRIQQQELSEESTEVTISLLDL